MQILNQILHFFNKNSVDVISQNVALSLLKPAKSRSRSLNKFRRVLKNLSCRVDKYFRINLFETFQKCYEFLRPLRDYVDCMSIYSWRKAK